MKNLTAKDIMNTNVISIRDDMTVHELANFFTEEMISGAPVMNKDDKLVGVVSVSDIIRNDEQRATIVHDKQESNYYLHGWEDDLNEDEIEDLHIEEDDALTVRDIMTPLIFKVPETECISSMADTMIGGRIHRLIVTKDDKAVGIITTLDLLKVIRDYTK